MAFFSQQIFKFGIFLFLAVSVNTFELLFPGTRWCGVGTMATSYDDLGLFRSTDICCRDHDLCDDNLLSNETRNGLHNDGLFTKSHCDCDLAFYNCLKRVGSLISLKVGIKFFNFASPKCYKNEHPATCVRYGGLLRLHKKCVEYTIDTDKPKVWQWFDTPYYF